MMRNQQNKRTERFETSSKDRGKRPNSKSTSPRERGRHEKKSAEEKQPARNAQSAGGRSRPTQDKEPDRAGNQSFNRTYDKPKFKSGKVISGSVKHKTVFDKSTKNSNKEKDNTWQKRKLIRSKDQDAQSENPQRSSSKQPFHKPRFKSDSLASDDRRRTHTFDKPKKVFNKALDTNGRKQRPETKFSKGKNALTDKDHDGIRLNKFIANAGFCSRREADTYIASGVISVNGIVITELGYKIKPNDKVMFGDRPVVGEKTVYVLLNKPKDFITTSKDPQNRKTIFDIISSVKERVFSVGRLDRNTTGLLLLTNDGILADKLMHPRKRIVKIYHAELDKKITQADLEQIMQGLELEDGFFTPDKISFVEGMDKKHVGIEIHSGRNRIVRRLFEHLGYKVVKLDRVFYAGLTKKGLSRGEWRYLEPREVGMLSKL